VPLTTYAEIQEEVAGWLQRDDLVGRIPNFILMAEARLNSLMRVREMMTIATITLTSGAGSLPTDYLEHTRVYANSSPVKILEQVDPDWAIEKYPDTGATTGQYFYILGSSIYTKPVVSSTLAMAYYQKIPALASNTTGNWLTTRAPQLYIYATCLEAAPFIDDDARAAVWGNLFEKGLAELHGNDIGRYKGVARIRGPVA
jgi:hypothetical protein